MLGLTSKTRPSWTVEGLEGLSCWLWGPEHVTVRGTCAALRRGSPGGAQGTSGLGWCSSVSARRCWGDSVLEA